VRKSSYSSSLISSNESVPKYPDKELSTNAGSIHFDIHIESSFLLSSLTIEPAFCNLSADSFSIIFSSLNSQIVI
jgi:hypothetical protein